jgi:hypothetical protein
MESGPNIQTPTVVKGAKKPEVEATATIYYAFPIINGSISLILWIIILAKNFYG